MIDIDKDKTFKVDARDFYKVMDRRLKIPNYLKEHEDQLLTFAQEYQDEDGRINYKHMIEHLKTFDYDQATNERARVSSKRSTSSFHSDMMPHMNKAKTIFDDDYIVLDAQKVPPNTLEGIERRLIKVNRYFQRRFGDEKSFKQALNSEVTSDKNGNVPIDQFKHFVL